MSLTYMERGQTLERKKRPLKIRFLPYIISFELIVNLNALVHSEFADTKENVSTLSSQRKKATRLKTHHRISCVA